MAQALLKAVNITKSFAGVQALKGVSLEIMPEKFIAWPAKTAAASLL